MSVPTWPRPLPCDRDARPDRHALLELQGLLTEIAALRSEGDADRFAAEARYQWDLHRLWIAVGNEALAYTQAIGEPIRADRIWANLYDLRNHLAHSRLPDIDESLVRRFTWASLDWRATYIVAAFVAGAARWQP